MDDFRFVAFLWGSAQLAGNEERDAAAVLSPAAAVADVADLADARHRGGHVFAMCMDAVHDRRLRPSHEDRATSQAEEQTRPAPPLWCHSYQLWNLAAAAPHWQWVNDRLAAAFGRDVLRRFSVVRRLMFGELLKFTRNPRPPGVSFYDCIPAEPEAEAPSDSDDSREKGPDVEQSAIVDDELQEEAVEEYEGGWYNMVFFFF